MKNEKIERRMLFVNKEKSLYCVLHNAVLNIAKLIKENDNRYWLN